MPNETWRILNMDINLKLSDKQLREWSKAYLYNHYSFTPIAGITQSCFKKVYQNQRKTSTRYIYVTNVEMIRILKWKVKDLLQPEEVFNTIQDFVYGEKVTIKTIEYIYKLHNSYKIDYWLSKQQNSSFYEDMGLFNIDFTALTMRYIAAQQKLSNYKCEFSIEIPTKSQNGIDLEEYRMREMANEIQDALKSKFPNINVVQGKFQLEVNERV